MPAKSILSILAAALLATPASADEDRIQRLRYDPKAVHAEVDMNKDGQIDHEEFHLRMVEIFFQGDRDKNGFMSFEEIEAVVVYPQGIRKADRNSDGRISLHEFVRRRFDDFEAVDGDADGLLSVQEVVSAWERGDLR